MPDYLSTRQNAVTADPRGKAELNSYLETVADEFGTTWLDQTGGNPVQDLWRARHALATNELLILGQAIQNLLKADSAWTRRQIAQMKSANVGERSGAAFEIIGLNLFTGPGQRIAPAPTNQPGYDGTVFLDDGASVLVSIKNHGVSSHETGFLTNAEEIRGEFVEGLRGAGTNARKMRVLALRQPLAADWSALRRQVRDIPSGKQPEDTPLWEGIRPWLARHASPPP